MKPVKISDESDFKLISDYLFDVGCCRICVLRFLDPNIDDFLDVESSLKSVKAKLKLNPSFYHLPKVNYRKTSRSSVLKMSQ